MKYPRAEVAIVKLGYFEFEGLYCKGLDKFGVAVPQVCSMFGLNRPSASRDLKRILGEGFGFNQWRTTEFLSTTKTNSGNKKLVNVVQLDDFNKLVLKLYKRDNGFANELVDLMNGLSWQQLFCDAFNHKFDNDDRQAWLRSRIRTKDSFWFLADSVAWWLKENPSVNRKDAWVYASVFDTLNVGLFGKTSQEIKKDLGIGKSALNRDHFGEVALGRIDRIQHLAQSRMEDPNINPKEAVIFAVETFGYTPMDYRN